MLLILLGSATHSFHVSGSKSLYIQKGSIDSKTQLGILEVFMYYVK